MLYRQIFPQSCNPCAIEDRSATSRLRISTIWVSMTIIARKMKVVFSHVLMKFGGKRLYSTGVSKHPNFKMEKESCSNLGLDFCVCTRHENENADVSSWHLINSNTHPSVYASPLPLGPDPPYGLYSAASFGSKVYMSGGFDYDRGVPTNEVFCMDTHHPEEGWKELPPMKHARFNHGSIFEGGKMYVWGDIFPPEVYYPNLNKWDSVYRVPQQVALRAFETSCHTDLNLNFEIIHESIYNMAYIGGILYGLNYFYPGDLLAFDPSNPRELKSVANTNRLHKYLPQCDNYETDEVGIPKRYVISLGDDVLGIVWLDKGPGKMRPLPDPKEVDLTGITNLRCSKFRMKHKKINGQLKFVADPIASFSCCIRGHLISHCVAVEPLLPRDEVVREEVKMKNGKRGNVVTKRGDKVIFEQAKKKNEKREYVEMEKMNRVYAREESPFVVPLGDKGEVKPSQYLQRLLESGKTKEEEVWEPIVGAACFDKTQKLVKNAKRKHKARHLEGDKEESYCKIK